MNQNVKSSSTLKLFFYLSFTILAFSSVEIIASPIKHQIDPMVITFWRFLLGSAFLLPFLLITDLKKIGEIQKIEWLKIALLGSLNIIISMGAHAACIKFANASIAAILISANPIATNFFSWLILKEEMGKKRIFALLLGFAGIILITLKANLAGQNSLLGITGGIIALIGFGLYTVLSKKMVQKHGSLTIMVTSSILALGIYLPLLLALNKSIMPTPNSWPHLLTLGIIGSGLGYITFFKSLEMLPAGKASYLFFIKPPVALFLAWIFLKETVSSAALVGTCLVMAGVVIDIKKKKKS